MINTRTKEQFIELRAQNKSYLSISKELNVSRPTLKLWAKDFEEEINSLRAVELEALQEKYMVGKRHRITLMGEHLQAVQDELKHRGYNFKGEPTSRLIELSAKLMKELKDEETAVTFSDEEDFGIRAIKSVSTWSG